MSTDCSDIQCCGVLAEASGRLRQHGFTLLELVFFILIVSIAVAGITQVYAVTAQSSADPMRRKQALTIAEGLLDEIELHAFSPPAAAYTGTNRSLFDHVSAYNGYTSQGVYAVDGQPVTGLSGYDISVTVVAPSAPIGGVSTNAIWQITVTVTDATGGEVILTGYRFNYG
jgi:MSHA pilin protein MshD